MHDFTPRLPQNVKNNLAFLAYVVFKRERRGTNRTVEGLLVTSQRALIPFSGSGNASSLPHHLRPPGFVTLQTCGRTNKQSVLIRKLVELVRGCEQRAK